MTFSEYTTRNNGTPKRQDVRKFSRKPQSKFAGVRKARQMSRKIDVQTKIAGFEFGFILDEEVVVLNPTPEPIDVVELPDSSKVENKSVPIKTMTKTKTKTASKIDQYENIKSIFYDRHDSCGSPKRQYREPPKSQRPQKVAFRLSKKNRQKEMRGLRGIKKDGLGYVEHDESNFSSTKSYIKVTENTINYYIELDGDLSEPDGLNQEYALHLKNAKETSGYESTNTPNRKLNYFVWPDGTKTIVKSLEVEDYYWNQY